MISIIVAIARKNVIGGDNALLWNIKEDLRRFREITSNHTVIMGRKTYESIGRPLPNRRNVVITRSNVKFEGCETFNSFEKAIKKYSKKGEEIFIIGGAEIYKQALPLADKLYLTRVHNVEYKGDAYFPKYDKKEWKIVYSKKYNRGEEYENSFTFTNLERIK